MAEIYSELPNSEPGIPYFPELITQDQELLEQLCRVHKSLKESPNPKVKSDLDSSLRTLIERYSRNRPEVLVFKENNPTAKKIEELKEYLTRNYAERIDTKQLAKEFLVSESTLSHYFKKLFNISPIAYRLQMRLARAKVLLVEGCTVSEVAEATGFLHDVFHFSKTFKHFVGTSPKSYMDSWIC